MRRVSVRIGRNFSPARNVRSMTAPSPTRRSLVRTKAAPLPGLTCWKSMSLKTVPSTSTCMPFLNWLVLTTARQGESGPTRRRSAGARHLLRSRREIHRGLEAGEELAPHDLVVRRAKGVDESGALIHLHAAALASAPPAQVHDEPSPADIEDGER